MNCSTPGFPVLHYVLGFAQVHVHCLSCPYFLFSLSSLFFVPPFLISFQSLVGHQERRKHGLLCIYSLKCPVSSTHHLPLLSALLASWLLLWHKLHPSTLISISDPLSPAPGSLASCHSSSAFRSSFYLFPGVLDCFGSYWYLESQRLFSRL